MRTTALDRAAGPRPRSLADRGIQQVRLRDCPKLRTAHSHGPTAPATRQSVAPRDRTPRVRTGRAAKNPPGAGVSPPVSTSRRICCGAEPRKIVAGGISPHRSSGVRRPLRRTVPLKRLDGRRLQHGGLPRSTAFPHHTPVAGHQHGSSRYVGLDRPPGPQCLGSH